MEVSTGPITDRYDPGMGTRVAACIATCAVLSACASERSTSVTTVQGSSSHARTTWPRLVFEVTAPEPCVIGDTFTIQSRILGEARRINTFVPTVYGEKIDAPLPVLYMPDGGMSEDFLHVAGLVQALVSNGGMRPIMVVGIENTVRRRDMTGPTLIERDLAIAPVVGGSAAFRRFIKEELMPTVRTRYRTTSEAAIVGESLAGLFVVETSSLEPGMFSTYIAIDPSLWWNDAALVRAAEGPLPSEPARAPDHGVLFLTNSDEPELAALTARLAGTFRARGVGDDKFHYIPLPTETHATIYHPAALLAFRTVFAPRTAGEK